MKTLAPIHAELVSVDRAKHLLDISKNEQGQSTNYRPVSSSHWQDLAREMSLGTYDEGRGDPLRIYDAGPESTARGIVGQLADGQHRLLAQIDRGLALQYYVQYVPGDWWGDTARKDRTFGDFIRAKHGDANVYRMAGITRVIATAKTGGARSKFTDTELDAVLSDWRSEIEWASGAVGYKWEPGISSGGSPTIGAFALARRRYADAAEGLAERCRTGAVKPALTVQTDPAHALRRLVADKAALGGQVRNMSLFAGATRAPQAEVGGKSAGLIRVRIAGSVKLSDAFARSTKWLLP